MAKKKVENIQEVETTTTEILETQETTETVVETIETIIEEPVTVIEQPKNTKDESVQIEVVNTPPAVSLSGSTKMSFESYRSNKFKK